MSDFRMPQLGADMADGTLTEWLKQPGEPVRRGDIVAVVETEKGAIEVEIFEDGVIDRLLVEPGTKVPVGTVLATLRMEGEAPSPPSQKSTEPPAVAAAMPVTVAAPPRPQTPAPAVGERIRISPAAARLAAEMGVDVRRLKGTGPQGAIRIADVEMSSSAAAAATQTPRPAEEIGSPAVAMRRAIAAAMGRSKREIPHYYLSTTIDMGRALDWLAGENDQRPVTERMLYSVLLVKAVAKALADFPELNGFWRDDGFEPAEATHIGWAISLRGGGLVAPAIHDAGQQNFDALMASLRDLVKRARAFRLRSSELSDPTITVTSLGEQGVESVYGVIYPPQVALVGFGRIVERPWVVDAAVEVRPLIRASLAADHRVSDGHRGGLFLHTLDRLLQEPEKL